METQFHQENLLTYPLDPADFYKWLQIAWLRTAVIVTPFQATEMYVIVCIATTLGSAIKAFTLSPLCIWQGFGLTSEVLWVTPELLDLKLKTEIIDLGE